MSADNFIALLITPAEDGGKEYRVTILQDSDSYGEEGFALLYQQGRRDHLINDARELWAGSNSV
jgi:hypothetical protein